jgi:AcrR family transcriptional regulator
MSTPARPAQAAKREAYRQLVLDSAEQLFARNGVEATKVEQISATAGLAPRTLYTVFASKQEIVDQVSERRRLELLRTARRQASGAPTPFDALLTGAAVATAYFLAHPDYLRMELKEGLAWADERSSRSTTWQDSIDTFVKGFVRCVDDGSVRPGDPLAYARALMAILQSQLAHWVAQGMAAEHDGVVADVTTLIMHAFATPATLRKHRGRSPEISPRRVDRAARRSTLG